MQLTVLVLSCKVKFNKIGSFKVVTSKVGGEMNRLSLRALGMSSCSPLTPCTLFTHPLNFGQLQLSCHFQNSFFSVPGIIFIENSQNYLGCYNAFNLIAFLAEIIQSWDSSFGVAVC
jgi:hypothetical protein